MKKEIGINFILDIYGVDEERLQNKNFLFKLLNQIIKILKMKRVGMPIVKLIKSKKYTNSGFSILQIISESHIAFHTWPEYNYLAIDIFTCKKFDEEKLKNFLKKKFEASKISLKKFKREVII